MRRPNVPKPTHNHHDITPKSRPCGFGQSLGRPIVQSFSHFFWLTKKNCPVSGNFWSVSGNFWSTKFLFGILKFFLVNQIFFWLTKNSQRLTKNSLRLDNFFLVDQKKWEKDRTIGWPRDWPKPHGRDSWAETMSILFVTDQQNLPHVTHIMNQAGTFKHPFAKRCHCWTRWVVQPPIW